MTCPTVMWSGSSMKLAAATIFTSVKRAIERRRRRSCPRQASTACRPATTVCLRIQPRLHQHRARLRIPVWQVVGDRDDGPGAGFAIPALGQDLECLAATTV